MSTELDIQAPVNSRLTQWTAALPFKSHADGLQKPAQAAKGKINSPGDLERIRASEIPLETPYEYIYVTFGVREHGLY